MRNHPAAGEDRVGQRAPPLLALPRRNRSSLFRPSPSTPAPQRFHQRAYHPCLVLESVLTLLSCSGITAARAHQLGPVDGTEMSPTDTGRGARRDARSRSRFRLRSGAASHRP